MTTEADHTPATTDVSPKGTDVVSDGAAEKEDDKISVGDLDEVSLEEGTPPSFICCVEEMHTNYNLHLHCATQFLFRKDHTQHY
jgi:hypothetical protein